MKYIAALYADGKVVTGCHHGDAFQKLSLAEQDSQITSGFLDPATGRFFTSEIAFFAKNLILIRHAHANDYFDPGISDLGRSQCNKVVQFLKESFDLSEYQGFASCCNRTRETAEHIFGSLGVSYQIRPDFCDHRNWHLPCWRADRWHETPYDFIERLRIILEQLPSHAIIISHCNFVANMAQLAAGIDDITIIPEWQNGIPHCSITCINNHKMMYVGKSLP